MKLNEVHRSMLWYKITKQALVWIIKALEDDVTFPVRSIKSSERHSWGCSMNYIFSVFFWVLFGLYVTEGDGSEPPPPVPKLDTKQGEPKVVVLLKTT